MPSSKIDPEVNTGISRIGPWSSTGSPSTIIVVGSGRGGTSACASIGRSLGLFSGNAARSPIFEDSYIAEAIESKNWSLAKEIANEYIRKHGTWLYKRPSSIDHLTLLNEILHQPKFVFVFRDPQATSYRISQFDRQAEPILNLERVLEVYQKALAFIKSNNPTGLLVSYEKLLASPSIFANDLASLAGIPYASASKLAEISSSIRASPIEYTETLNSSRFFGHIDYHGSDKITGWAAQRGVDAACEIDLRINGRTILTVPADLKRPDVKASGVHSNENCGFEVDLKVLGNGDRARIYLKGSELHL